MFWKVRATPACCAMRKPSMRSSRNVAVRRMQRQPADRRLVEAGQAVEHRGLAGAVRADDGGDLARSRRVNETSSTATRPPKRMVRCSTSSSGAVAVIAPGWRRSRLLRLGPARPCSRMVGSRWASSPRGRQTMISTMPTPKASMRYSANSRKNSGRPMSTMRRQHHADLAAHAAQHDDREDHRRFDEGEALRADEALAGGEERAGEAAEHRADGEGGELGVGRVDAERAAGDLVLAQRLPGAADRQLADAHGEEVGEQRQHQDQVVEEDDRGGWSE